MIEAAAGGARAWLERHVGPQGAWGYRPGQAAMGEPTLLATAAGLPAPLPWLGQADLGWTRLMAPACLHRSPGAAALTTPWVEHILGHRGTGGETAGSFDGDLPGWPWVEGTFSWVEPTAWAVLSLRLAGPGAHPRIDGGLATLADRQCVDGGWNAGTPDILGQDLFGYLYLTGLVLVALPPGHPAAAAGLAFLDGASERPSPLNLAWAALARAAHGLDPGPAARALVQHQSDDGGFSGRADRTALALAALRVSQGDGCALLHTPAATLPP